MSSYPVIGYGTYGTVLLESVVVKDARSEDEVDRVQTFSIVETSILKHLQSLQPKSSLLNPDQSSYRSRTVRYHPFPIIYHSRIERDETSVGTYTMMNYVGRTLSSIIRDSGFDTLLDLIDRHYYRLMEVIRIMHSCGVIHMDLHLDNITLDDQDRIHIIDFGLSTIGSLQPLVENSVPGPNNIPSADLWKLAASIVVTHTGEEIIPDREWAVKQLLREYPELDPIILRQAVDQGTDYQDEYEEVELTIPVPDSIPQPLNGRLSRMLSINPNNRGYPINSIYTSQPTQSMRTFDKEYQNLFGSSLDHLLSRISQIDGVDNCDLGIAIDLLCRVFQQSNSITNRQVATNIADICITLALRVSLDSDIMDALTNQLDDNLANYQAEILDLLDWRVFTGDNTILDNNSIIELVDRIRLDPDYNSYVNLSTSQLMDRLQYLL